jgi:hypothetical protein
MGRGRIVEGHGTSIPPPTALTTGVEPVTPITSGDRSSL